MLNFPKTMQSLGVSTFGVLSFCICTLFACTTERASLRPEAQIQQTTRLPKPAAKQSSSGSDNTALSKKGMGKQTKAEQADGQSLKRFQIPKRPSVFRLQAKALCTRRACMPSKPCCNTCRFGGWQLAKDPSMRIVSARTLPEVEVNGCGEASKALQISGRAEPGALHVHGSGKIVNASASDLAAAKASSKQHYLMAKNGAQCEFSQTGTAQSETKRLKALSIEVARINVAPESKHDKLPPACAKAVSPAYWEAFAYAKIQATAMGKMTCAACGCPEVWLYCLATSSSKEALKAAGYAPAIAAKRRTGRPLRLRPLPHKLNKAEQR